MCDFPNNIKKEWLHQSQGLYQKYSRQPLLLDSIRVPPQETHKSKIISHCAPARVAVIFGPPRRGNIDILVRR